MGEEKSGRGVDGKKGRWEKLKRITGGDERRRREVEKRHGEKEDKVREGDDKKKVT